MPSIVPDCDCFSLCSAEAATINYVFTVPATKIMFMTEKEHCISCKILCIPLGRRGIHSIHTIYRACVLNHYKLVLTEKFSKNVA